MKVFLLLALFLGATVARPNAAKKNSFDKKALEGELKRLLNQILEKKEAGSGSGSGSSSGSEYSTCPDTTLFDNTDYCPEGGFADFKFKDLDKPLDVSEVNEHVIEVLNNVADATDSFAEDLIEYAAEYSDVVGMINEILKDDQNNSASYDPEEDVTNSINKMIRGAYAGTTGGDRNEVGCDFDAPNHDLATCLAHQGGYLLEAIAVEAENSSTALDVYGCISIFEYLDNNEPGYGDAIGLATSLSESLQCVASKLYARVDDYNAVNFQGPLPQERSLFGLGINIFESYGMLFYQLWGALDRADTELSLGAKKRSNKVRQLTGGKLQVKKFMKQKKLMENHFVLGKMMKTKKFH